MPSEYSSDEIVVTYDADICIHAGNCVGQLPAVFNLDNDPWISPGAASVEAVEATVKACPSGALGVRRVA